MSKRTRSGSQSSSEDPTSENHPSKKQATENPDESSSSKPLNAIFRYTDPTGSVQPTFCFDGSLVVLKTSGNPPVYFQASRSALIKQSRIFADMFSLPQPNDAEKFEGQPLVVFQDDPADLQVFLRALHEFREFFANPSWATRETLSSLLRLSTKYQVIHIRQMSMQPLSGNYPTTLQVFDSPQRPRATRKTLFNDFKFSKEISALPLLPALYYLCAGAANSDLLRGNSPGRIDSRRPKDLAGAPGVADS